MGGVVYAVSAGVHLLCWRSETAAGLERGVVGHLALAVGGAVPQRDAVDLVSLAALVLLLHARPAAGGSDPHGVG